MTRARNRKLGVRGARTSNSANLWSLKVSNRRPRSHAQWGHEHDALLPLRGDPNILAAEYAGIALDLTTSEAEAIADAIVVFKTAPAVR